MSVVATFKTRCGCTQIREVPCLSQTYVIPMKQRSVYSRTGETLCKSIDYRKFKLTEYDWVKNQGIYEEV